MTDQPPPKFALRVTSNFISYKDQPYLRGATIRFDTDQEVILAKTLLRNSTIYIRLADGGAIDPSKNEETEQDVIKRANSIQRGELMAPSPTSRFPLTTPWPEKETQLPATIQLNRQPTKAQLIGACETYNLAVPEGATNSTLQTIISDYIEERRKRYPMPVADPNLKQPTPGVSTEEGIRNKDAQTPDTLQELTDRDGAPPTDLQNRDKKPRDGSPDGLDKEDQPQSDADITDDAEDEENANDQ